ncbi:MAG: glycosyltransferase family 4 protein [Deferrisomatales bacterium]|nr:glycosyltransferase family 4 protein [Deferrisomatales bacterium]
MRVFHLDTGRIWRGGQQQVLNLHRGLRGRGVASFLLCRRGGELAARAAAAGLPTETLPLRGEWDLPSALAVARRARRAGARVVHAHCSHSVTLGAVVCRLVPSLQLVATRRVDFVPGTGPFHHWKYSRPARWIAISTAIRDILIRTGVAAGRVRVVPSGVDPDRPRPGTGARVRAEWGIGSHETLVGNIAHLADHKGQRYLVEAIPRVLERHPGVRFAIVGEGELEVDLKARGTRLALGDRLLFPGFRRDVEAVMDALDLFVLPSHMEGLGTIVLDAMMAGKPVVATRTGGVPDVVEDGVTGLLVPPRDPAALADALCRALADPAGAALRAAAARRRVVERFSVDAMVEGNLAVYRELFG